MAKRLPKDKPDATQVDKLSDRSNLEALPIRTLVYVGTGFAATAILATALAIGLAVLGTEPFERGSIYFVSTDTEERIQMVCSGFDDDTSVEFQREGDLIVIKLGRDSCGGATALVTVRAEDAVLLSD